MNRGGGYGPAQPSGVACGDAGGMKRGGRYPPTRARDGDAFRVDRPVEGGDLGGEVARAVVRDSDYNADEQSEH